MSDAALLAATGSDPEAFAGFYDRYETSLVGYFVRRTGDPEVAADLTAEVFAAALAAAPRYRPAGSDGRRLAVHDRSQHAGEQYAAGSG